MNQRLTAIIEREEDGYVALCPEYDVVSQGASIEEARQNLREALELFFECASAGELSGAIRARSTSLRSRLPLGRLATLSGPKVCAILERHGFGEVRRRGSHIVMQRQDGPTTITAPVPDHKELRIGTLRAIIR